MDIFALTMCLFVAGALGGSAGDLGRRYAPYTPGGYGPSPVYGSSTSIVLPLSTSASGIATLAYSTVTETVAMGYVVLSSLVTVQTETLVSTVKASEVSAVSPWYSVSAGNGSSSSLAGAGTGTWSVGSATATASYSFSSGKSSLPGTVAPTTPETASYPLDTSSSRTTSVSWSYSPPTPVWPTWTTWTSSSIRSSSSSLAGAVTPSLSSVSPVGTGTGVSSAFSAMPPKYPNSTTTVVVTITATAFATGGSASLVSSVGGSTSLGSPVGGSSASYPLGTLSTRLISTTTVRLTSFVTVTATASQTNSSSSSFGSPVGGAGSSSSSYNSSTTSPSSASDQLSTGSISYPSLCSSSVSYPLTTLSPTTSVDSPFQPSSSATIVVTSTSIYHSTPSSGFGTITTGPGLPTYGTPPSYPASFHGEPASYESYSAGGYGGGGWL